jgi:hypothetical protein
MLGYNPQVILAGRRINDGMGKFIAEKTVKLMIQSGSNIKGARVNVLGLTFKENCPDLRNSKVPDIIRELQSYGCNVHVHDPVAESAEAEHEYGVKLTPWAQLPRANAIVAALNKAPLADSRTIQGEAGAEQLLGQGDMLYMAAGGRIARVHGAFVSDTEVEQIVRHVKAQGQPEYLHAVLEDDEEDLVPEVEERDGPDEFGAGGGGSEDELYSQAVALVVRERKCSVSFVQRHLQIGYNRSARIVERMENEGVVTPANHAG